MNALTPFEVAVKGRLPDKLPELTSAAEVLSEVLDDFVPEERLTVSQSAEKYRRIDTLNKRGPWDNSAAPYMCEPCDTAMSRRYKAGVFIGPARTLKTSSFIENVTAHFIKVAPRTTRIITPDQKLAREFSISKIDAMLRASPELKAMQRKGRGSDNVYDKVFRGMSLSIGWPVISQLSQSDIPVVLFSDFDRIKNMDVDGEGDPFILGRKRNQTFGSLGWTGLECSPGFEITDTDWYPKTPHEAPPVRGGLGHYNDGTRGRFYWTCPHCDEKFEPDWPLIQFDQDPEKPAAERARSAVLICPASGCIIIDADRPELNRTGTWLHEAKDDENNGLCLLEEEDRIRETDTASWWVKGPPAAFQSMVFMVEQVLKAEAKFDKLLIEEDLKAVFNTTLGLPYLSRIQTNESELNSGALWDRADTRPLGVAPAGTRLISVHVDTQATRFPVQVVAWGPGLEHWTIDRFDLAVPPETAPLAERDESGQPRRQLSPAKYAEDWDVLKELEAKVWPVDGADYGLRPLGVTIDSVGEPGVTDNARRFWRRMKKDNLHMRFHLVQGVTRDYGNRVDRRYPEVKTKDRKKKRNTRRKSDVPIAFIVSNRLKDEVAASLLREADGPGRHHLTQALGRSFFEEIVAEERVDAKWSLKSGVKRNEAFDLAYHAKAFMVLMGAEEVDWDSPSEAWAIEGAENMLAVPINPDEIDQIDPAEGLEVQQVQPTKQKSIAKRRAERLAEYAKARLGL